MSQPATFLKIKNMISEVNAKARPESIELTTDLFSTGALDSYATVQLVNSIERVFDLVFDYADMNAKNFTTIESILHLLKSKYKVEIT